MGLALLSEPSVTQMLTCTTQQPRVGHTSSTRQGLRDSQWPGHYSVLTSHFTHPSLSHWHSPFDLTPCPLMAAVWLEFIHTEPLIQQPYTLQDIKTLAITNGTRPWLWLKVQCTGFQDSARPLGLSLRGWNPFELGQSQ